MAIQYMDNFQIYGTGSGARAYMLAGMPWSQLYSLSEVVDDPDTNADSDSRALKFVMNGTGSDGCRLAIPSAGQQMGVGCRLWFSSLPNAYENGGGLQFNTASNTPLYLVAVGPTGNIRLYRRSGNNWTDNDDTVVATTTGPVVTAGAWYHWEFYIDTSTGDYELRIEGVTVLDGNDASHHSDSIGIFELIENWDCTEADSDFRYCKDLIIWDDTGSQNNTFIGPVTVYSLQVDSDVTLTDATPSTGSTAYATMDELSVSDSDYTTLGTTPSSVEMTFENVPADVVAIRALQTVVRAQKTDGGDATMQVGLISAGDEDTGSDDAVNTSFRYHYDVSELNPDTAAAWTPTNTNSATIKINRTL